MTIKVHTFFWVVYVAFTYLLCKLYLEANPNAPFSQHLFYVIFLELVMGLILFYTAFFGLKWSTGKKSRQVAVAGFLLFLVLFFAAPAIMRYGFWELMSSIIPHIIIIFLALIFRKFSDSIVLEQEKQALLLKTKESELALLKMQISPHFLFNTLNNIDFLITKDPDKASDSIARLGDILRYQIYEADTEKIELSRELSNLEEYIELIRLRTSGANYLNFKITGTPGHLRISPMLFLPLVENAYKHSATKEGENVVQIDIQINNNMLHFLIRNLYNSTLKPPPGEGGIGLNQVKRRLELIYPGKHKFTVTNDNDRFNVELIVELDDY